MREASQLSRIVKSVFQTDICCGPLMKSCLEKQKARLLKASWLNSEVKEGNKNFLLGEVVAVEELLLYLRDC